MISSNEQKNEKLSNRRMMQWAGCVFILSLVVRLIGVGTFMTVDEEVWMIRSGDFYHKLFDKNDPGGTFTTSHPGATTMWLAGAGIYGQEKMVGTGVDTSNLGMFRIVSALPMAIAAALLVALATYLTARLMGMTAAGWTGWLLATEPYLVGMSQIVHVDMLLAMFMLTAVMCLLIYRENLRWRWLAGAGVMTGLAFGTKLLPALWLVVISAAMIKGRYGWFIIPLKKRDWKKVQAQIIAATGEYLFYAGIAVVIFYLVWPALWVKTNLDDYYKRDVVTVATQEHVSLVESEEPVAPISFYGRTVLARTTPFVLLLAAGMIIGWIRFYGQELIWRHAVGRLRRHDQQGEKENFVSASAIGWLIAYGLGYLILITIMAKKADRYALPALAVLPVLAGGGLAIVQLALSKRTNFWGNKWWRWTIVGLVAAAIMAQYTSWMPYMIAYNSPFFNVRPLSSQGWGEGLDAAARWLNSHPLGEKLTVASWYPGVMRAYFKGDTMSLSSRHDDRVGYVVTYRNMQGRGQGDAATSVLEEFKGKVPEKVIKINGVEHAWIYNVIGLKYFTNNTGELFGEVEVGQKITAPANWQRVDIGLANYSGRQNTQAVALHIKRRADDKTDVRTVTVSAAEIEDMAWHRFEFEPLENRAGEEFYLALTSQSSRPGDAITALYSPVDFLAGQMVWRNRALRRGERNSDFGREGFDLAYRFMQP